ncbi:hypothetical protein HPP92_003075 [Vanilla planifolia]|uniref:Uncharacterized protein n=1 Tax=Vanilla planifolia TaxID=51239 RepID=A0A835VF40_VANPL|nr:hypothetical protein HPP92_003075 [Vanilla planifolia]
MAAAAYLYLKQPLQSISPLFGLGLMITLIAFPSLLLQRRGSFFGVPMKRTDGSSKNILLWERRLSKFKLHRVIGEVVDLFVPTVNMSVSFASKHVSNGCDVKPSAAINPPTVLVSGQPTDLFTLVMTDPDAPSPSEPSMREFVHWIVVNIPGGTDATRGQELVPYMGPQPPVGIHRYALVLFQQKAAFRSAAPPASRAHFSTREFARYYELSLPVAAAYFNSQKEPAVRRR